MSDKSHPLMLQVFASYQKGKLPEAVALCQQILQDQPKNFEALFNLGMLLSHQGLHSQAVHSLLSAIEVNGQSAQAFSALALNMCKLDQFQAAVECFSKAIQLQPGTAAFLGDRGNAYKALKQLPAALADYNAALALQPDALMLLNNRGVLHLQMGQATEALRDHDRAIALYPESAQAHCFRGNALKQMMRLSEAVESYQAALRLNANYDLAHSNLGLALKDQHRLDLALHHFDCAIALNPALTYAHWNKATTCLLAGDYTQGWALFEWRFKLQTVPKRQTPADSAPLWLGQEPLEGRSILVVHEQGLGDTIQFCRYLPLLAKRGAKVLVKVPAPLLGILAEVDGVAELMPLNATHLLTDFQIPMMSLPLAFKTNLETIPLTAGYLRANATKTQHWQQLLGPRQQTRVGLVWAGGLRSEDKEVLAVNLRRNIPLSLLEPLGELPFEFYSLQKGLEAEAELADTISQGWHGPHIIDHTQALEDFSDTAALIDQLDLVISVDTSTAHLAAAMGKPVWLLNRSDTCWRWMLERTDSPWYETVEQFRQGQPGDWSGVVNQVVERLRHL